MCSTLNQCNSKFSYNVPAVHLLSFNVPVMSNAMQVPSEHKHISPMCAFGGKLSYEGTRVTLTTKNALEHCLKTCFDPT